MYYAIMPRIAKPATPECLHARDQLRQFLVASRLSGNQLAHRSGVAQSTVSRFLTGRTKNLTKALEPVLAYAKIEIIQRIDETPEAIDNLRLREALESAAAMGPEAAELLVRLVEAIALTLKSYPIAPRSNP